MTAAKDSERVSGWYRAGWRKVDPEELIDAFEERAAIVRHDATKSEDEARRIALACLRARFKIAERVPMR